ncbi:MAG: transketolase [Gemmatimonadota bacterium]
MTEARTEPTARAGGGRAGGLEEMPADELAVHTIRTLSMDAVEAADSGHPGTPMALAPVAYLLYRHVMRHNPADPDWFDRDRFVLSAGHASMLQYAALHLCGYDLPLDEIRDFRQWGSRTPGHPENFVTPGVETTTGPLGQGVMNSVGMALAEAHLADVFNRPGHRVIDHRTWVICSDGDLMEGASHEAASVAGHLGLDKLTWIYDDNRVTIDGSTDLAYSDDVGRRFEGYGWHVQDLGDRANDLKALSGALGAARAETDRPSLVVVRSHIGYGAPEKQDTAAAHGAPLGPDEVRAAKRFYGWPEDETFLVPDRAREHMEEARRSGRELQEEWERALEAYRDEHPDLARRLEAAVEGRRPEGWEDDLPEFGPDDGPMATRDASGAALEALAPRLPALVGGSADLTGSNRTHMEVSGIVRAGEYGHRNLRWGVREHVMCGASSGMALHGGVRPFAATFFIFTDYARPAIRLAAMMELPVVYVLTHDSVGLGEDGPTHQPVEHLASFRAMPGMCVIRPADPNETVEAWRAAVRRDDGPTMLVLTRQGVPVLGRSGPDGRRTLADPTGLHRGAYVLATEERGAPAATGNEGAGGAAPGRPSSDDTGDRPDLVLMGSGSEVQHLLGAQRLLEDEGLRVRVVSMPSWELFRRQPSAYRDRVIPPDVPARLAVEAAATLGWDEWVGPDGDVLGLDRFGASAPAEENFRRFGFTAENVAERARSLL